MAVVVVVVVLVPLQDGRQGPEVRHGSLQLLQAPPGHQGHGRVVEQPLAHRLRAGGAAVPVEHAEHGARGQQAGDGAAPVFHGCVGGQLVALKAQHGARGPAVKLGEAHGLLVGPQDGGYLRLRQLEVRVFAGRRVAPVLARDIPAQVLEAGGAGEPDPLGPDREATTPCEEQSVLAAGEERVARLPLGIMQDP